ncbi:lipopolysaccharide biosynthesis protein [Akkermansiaceae bacterium]|nr:lipopolysaccharide biosynthesis protein [Akkermansiaceae bacterium]MDB4735068.1 lipopolysaccharide biosynthesis protein [Akkermansiaceae bacterium]
MSESNSKDLKQAAIVGGAWGGVSRLVRVVCQLASIIFLSRLLTPEDFGVVATVASLVTVVNLLRELGLAHAIVQQPKIHNDELNCLFKFTCLLGVGLFATSILIGFGASWFFGDGRLVYLAPFYGLASMLSSVEVIALGLLRRKLKFQTIAIREIVAGIIGTGGSILIAWMGGGYWAIVAAPVLMQLTNTILSWKAVSWRPKRSNSPMRSISHYLKFGATVTLGEFANLVSANVDRIMVGKIWGFSQLGFYSRSHLMVSVPTEIVASPVNSTLLPILTKMNDDPERKRKWIIHFYRAMLVSAGTLAAALYATAGEVIFVLMGDGWNPVVPLIMWLTPCLFIKPAGGVLYSALIGEGDIKALMAWSWIGNLITVLAIVASVHYGLQVLAVSISGALFLRMFVSIFIVNRSLGTLAGPLMLALVIGVSNFLGCAYLFSELKGLIGHHDFGVIMVLIIMSLATAAILGIWGVSDPSFRRFIQPVMAKIRKIGKAA